MLKFTKSPTCLAARRACAREAPLISIDEGMSMLGRLGEFTVLGSRGRMFRSILPKLRVSTPDSLV